MMQLITDAISLAAILLFVGLIVFCAGRAVDDGGKDE